MNKFEKHIQIDRSQTIVEVLSENIDLSKQQLKTLMQNGAVWLENAQGIHRVRRAKKLIHEHDCLHVYYDEGVQEKVPPVANLIVDMSDYSIWNKPCGMFSQGTKWGDHCTLYRWAEQHLMPQRQAFIVHRLDKAANGLMIIAHKKTMAAKFSNMFEQREVHKKYRALVEGDVDIQLPCEIKSELDGKPAISEIISINKKNNNQTEVEIEIKTGRKHQIRRHLSALGYPIVGDRLYGHSEVQKNNRVDLQLSSIELAFMCPVTDKPVKYNLP